MTGWNKTVAQQRGYSSAGSMCTSTSAIRDSRCWDRRFLLSAVFGLCLDDVGIGTCTAVKGSDPVVVERIRSQTGHISTSHVAYVQIVINRYVSAKGIARRHVQPVTGRTAYAGPVGSEATGSLIGVL